METLVPSMVTRMLKKSEPVVDASQHGLITVKNLTAAGDQLFVSRGRTELTTRGKRQPSKFLVSPMGRKVLYQNPGLERAIFSGSYPQNIFFREYIEEDGHTEKLGAGSDCSIYIANVNIDEVDSPIIIKYHGEGRACYPHETSEGDTLALSDKVGGIDNFMALRSIDQFAPNLRVPEPLFATQRLFVARYQEGEVVCPIPKWVEAETRLALNFGYHMGWLHPGKRLGIFPGRYRVDLPSDGTGWGNVLVSGGQYFVIDPIS